MEGFRFCRDSKADKWLYRIGFALIGIGLSTIFIGIGFGIVFLYSHLAWNV